MEPRTEVKPLGSPLKIPAHFEEEQRTVSDALTWWERRLAECKLEKVWCKLWSSHITFPGCTNSAVLDAYVCPHGRCEVGTIISPIVEDGVTEARGGEGPPTASSGQSRDLSAGGGPAPSSPSSPS